MHIFKANPALLEYHIYCVDMSAWVEYVNWIQAGG